MLDTHRFTDDGFAIVPDVLRMNELEPLIAVINANIDPARPHALRHLLAIPAIRTLAVDARVRGLAEQAAGHPVVCVRGILFDKTPDSNWKVIWHQDRTVALSAKMESAAFGPWSIKDGIPHADASADILGQMVTIRLHLDPCDQTNGPLRVIAGSHRHGKLDDCAIRHWRNTHAETTCELPGGGALLMRPLLLHASAPATSPRHRRVIHLEYGPASLPDGVRWHDAM